MGLAYAHAPDDQNRVLRTVLGGFLFGGTALIALHNWFGLADSFGDFFNGPLYDAVVLSAGIACLLRAARGGRERAAWLMITATLLTQATTELTSDGTLARFGSAIGPGVSQLAFSASPH